MQGGGGQWRCTPLIPALRKQKQVDLCEFEASLVYRMSPRTVMATQRTLVLKNRTNRKKRKRKSCRAVSFLASEAL